MDTASIPGPGLPEYDRPPVVEVVCGVLFPSSNLNIGHLGAWWSTVAKHFPKCQEVAPIVPLIENLEGSEAPQFVEFPDSPRLWLISHSEDQLIQVQKDRFLFNWRKTDERHEYPRYHSVKASFDKYREAFVAFAESHVGEKLRPVQFELTYINHVAQDESSWMEPVQIGSRLLPDFAWRTTPGRYLPDPESIDHQAKFLLPNRSGRLHVRVRDARRKSDNRRIALVELTARGFSESMDGWFDTAHEWIVRGFADLADNGAQKDLWRRTK